MPRQALSQNALPPASKEDGREAGQGTFYLFITRSRDIFSLHAADQDRQWILMMALARCARNEKFELSRRSLRRCSRQLSADALPGLHLNDKFSIGSTNTNSPPSREIRWNENILRGTYETKDTTLKSTYERVWWVAATSTWLSISSPLRFSIR